MGLFLRKVTTTRPWHHKIELHCRISLDTSGEGVPEESGQHCPTRSNKMSFNELSGAVELGQGEGCVMGSERPAKKDMAANLDHPTLEHVMLVILAARHRLAVPEACHSQSEGRLASIPISKRVRPQAQECRN